MKSKREREISFHFNYLKVRYPALQLLNYEKLCSFAQASLISHTEIAKITQILLWK